MQAEKQEIAHIFGQDFRVLLVLINIIIWAFVSVSAGILALRDGNVELFAFMGIALFLFCVFASISTLSQSLGKNILLYAGVACLCAGVLLFVGHISAVLSGIFMLFLFFGLLVAHWHVIYFERDRLAVHWVPVVRTFWKYTTFAVMLFLMLYIGFIPLQGTQERSQQIWESFFKGIDPVLESFGLPQSHTPLSDAISHTVQKKFPEKEENELKALQDQAQVESIQRLQETLGFSVSSRDTFGVIMQSYLVSVWENLSSIVQSGIRMIGAILFLLFFQPIILFVGNILSFVAPWMMRFLRNIGMFDIILEPAQKERVFM